MSDKYYKGKFDCVFVVSPSIQKLGIKTKKEYTNSSYDLPWIFNQFALINQNQIKKFERCLKATEIHKRVPHIAQSVIQQSLGREMKNSKVGRNTSLPPEYISFNKNQRFFTIETLAIMGQGYKANGELGQDPNTLQMPSKKRNIKEELKRAIIPTMYGKYKDVDDIQEHLVDKLDPADHEATRVNILLVLDDVIGDIKANENNKQQAELFFNRRHVIANGQVSIILVSQKYTMIPSRIRSTCQWMILFRLNPIDFENVYKDVVMLQPAKWQAILDTVFQINDDSDATKENKKYDHLDIFVEYDMFFKNFNKLTIR